MPTAVERTHRHSEADRIRTQTVRETMAVPLEALQYTLYAANGASAKRARRSVGSGSGPFLRLYSGVSDGPHARDDKESQGGCAFVR